MKFYIAIPVYKAEAFLSECVSSVLNQTCQDFEIVLVDDGSPDGSGRLCDEFAARDGRIHVIHQKNTGPYGARRTAIHFILDHGSPEDRAVFLDADDSLKPWPGASGRPGQTWYSWGKTRCMKAKCCGPSPGTWPISAQ